MDFSAGFFRITGRFAAISVLIQVRDDTVIQALEDSPEISNHTLYRVDRKFQGPHHRGRTAPLHQLHHPALVLDFLDAGMDRRVRLLEGSQIEPVLSQLIGD